jgi:hypothetical protein
MSLQRYKVLPESILQDPEVLGILSDAARNALKGVQSSRINPQSDTKKVITSLAQSVQTKPVLVSTGSQTVNKLLPARQGRPGLISISDTGSQTTQKTYSETGTQPEEEVEEAGLIGDIPFSPILSSSPKNTRIKKRMIKDLMHFVPEKYRGKGALMVPLILKMLNYENEQDRAIALLNYIILDEDPNGMVPPPSWARPYLTALLRMQVSPNLFAPGKRTFYNEEFLRDVRSHPNRSIAETNSLLASNRKRGRLTISSPFATGSRTDRTIPEITIEDTF